MILWFRHLPPLTMDLNDWTPFIKNTWFRTHFMKFVYLLQISLVLMYPVLAQWISSFDLFFLIIIAILVFLIHECLHILVIHRKGDISITFSGIFFWINTNAVLTKARFWIFMSLPLLALTVLPAILSFFVTEDIKSLLIFVSWANAIISGADIINSFLIAIKPKNSLFCRGYFRVEEQREIKSEYPA